MTGSRGNRGRGVRGTGGRRGGVAGRGGKGRSPPLTHRAEESLESCQGGSQEYGRRQNEESRGEGREHHYSSNSLQSPSESNDSLPDTSQPVPQRQNNIQRTMENYFGQSTTSRKQSKRHSGRVPKSCAKKSRGYMSEEEDDLAPCIDGEARSEEEDDLTDCIDEEGIEHEEPDYIANFDKIMGLDIDD